MQPGSSSAQDAESTCSFLVGRVPALVRLVGGSPARGGHNVMLQLLLEKWDTIWKDSLTESEYSMPGHGPPDIASHEVSVLSTNFRLHALLIGARHVWGAT
jgi:hypothetical protein